MRAIARKVTKISVNTVGGAMEEMDADSAGKRKLEDDSIENRASKIKMAMPISEVINHQSENLTETVIVPTEEFSEDEFNEFNSSNNPSVINAPSYPTENMAQVNENIQSSDIHPSNAGNESDQTQIDVTNQGESTADENSTKKSGVIIMDLIGESKTRNLILDTDNLRYMLSVSIFRDKHAGRPIFNYNSHSIKLYINDSRDIPELVKVNKLVKNGVDWPVNCRVPQNIQEKYGVLRGIHPEIPIENVKESLIRNGAQVATVERIINRAGPTFCVKISFANNIVPERVYYDGLAKTSQFFNTFLGQN